MEVGQRTGKRLKCEQGSKAPREIESRYRRFFENCPVAICITTRDGRILAANESASALFGYSSQEMVEMNVQAICADSANWERFQEKLEQKGYSGDHQVKFTKRDGTNVDCLLTVNKHRANDGGIEEYQCVIWDATEYNRRLKALRESETRYRLLAENVTDGLWTAEWDADLKVRFTYFTESISNVLGYTKDELMPMTLEDILTPASVKRGIKALKEHLAVEDGRQKDLPRSWTVELEMYHKNGGTVWAEATTALLRDQDGKPVGTLGMTRDITERKRKEDALRALSRRLVEAQEAERRHIARELHDQIGQALTRLKLSLEMADRLPMEEAMAASRDAKQMIDELIAKIRDLSLDLRPPMLDDLGLLTTLQWYFERYTAQTGIRVVFEPEGLQRRFAPEVETAVYRIVQEALTNVARHAGVRETTVRLLAKRHTLTVQIADHGAGFNPERELGAGKSSGLAGMRERATSLGGQLTVHSASGRGTRLVAELPLKNLPKDGSMAR